MRLCKRGLQIVLLCGVVICLIIFLLYMKESYSAFGIELCVADYLIICLDPKIIGLLIGSASLLIVFPIVDNLRINAVIRYKSKEKYYLFQLVEIVKKTFIIIAVFEIIILIGGFITCREVINWGSADSYYYIRTWHTNNVGIMEVCLKFMISAFIGLLTINILFCSIRWISKTVIPGFITCVACVICDTVGISVVFRRLDFTESWIQYNYPVMQYVVPIVILFSLSLITLLLCKSKEFYHER